MLSIGGFARFGQVSVRMLRHYDAIGLLAPARVDECTGYRSYRAKQFARLNRIVALKELGFTLDQVRRILDDDLGIEELRGMLTLRQAQIATERAQVDARLLGVEHRLRLIAQEDHMSDIEYVVKSLPARTLAARSATAASQAEIAAVVGPLFGEIAREIASVGGCPETGVGVYDMSEDGLEMLIGYDYAGAAVDASFEVVALPAVPDAVCAVHLGAMETVHDSWLALSRWADANGWSPDGPCREIHLLAEPQDDQSGWVTELQQPVVRG